MKYRTIQSVYRFKNGMVAVFDRAGEQMPQYQGHYHAVRKAILDDAPPETVFFFMDWNSKAQQPLKREEF